MSSGQCLLWVESGHYAALKGCLMSWHYLRREARRRKFAGWRKFERYSRDAPSLSPAPPAICDTVNFLSVYVL